MEDVEKLRDPSPGIKAVGIAGLLDNLLHLSDEAGDAHGVLGVVPAHRGLAASALA